MELLLILVLVVVMPLVDFLYFGFSAILGKALLRVFGLSNPSKNQTYVVGGIIFLLIIFGGFHVFY